MRRSPHPQARRLLLLAAAPLLVALVAACGNSTQCAATCGTGGTSTTGTGGTGGTGGAGGQVSPTFPCKKATCMRGTEVCDVTTHFQANPTGACAPIPKACTAATADCTCFGTLMTGCTCEKQPTGEFDVFCNVDM
jgi:hypothetical protein